MLSGAGPHSSASHVIPPSGPFSAKLPARYCSNIKIFHHRSIRYCVLWIVMDPTDSATWAIFVPGYHDSDSAWMTDRSTTEDSSLVKGCELLLNLLLNP